MGIDRSTVSEMSRFLIVNPRDTSRRDAMTCLNAAASFYIREELRCIKKAAMKKRKSTRRLTTIEPEDDQGSNAPSRTSSQARLPSIALAASQNSLRVANTAARE